MHNSNNGNSSKYRKTLIFAKSFLLTYTKINLKKMKFSFVKHILKDNHEYNFTRLIDDILMKYDKYSITDNEIVQ